MGRGAVPVVTALLLLCACRVDVIHDLDEAEANHVVTALHGRGIGAEKVRAVEGNKASYTVRVPSGEATRAWRALREEHLPRPRRSGMGEVFGKQGLIPTPTQERALYHHALAEEIGKTLQAAEGVLEARVHVVLPTRDPLTPADTPLAQPRASVLLRYAPPPVLSREDVQRLVAGSVDGLKPEAVTVVMVPGAARGGRPAVPSASLAQVGPFSVAEGSRPALRLLLAGGALLVLLLAAGLGLLARRHRALASRLRAVESGSASPPAVRLSPEAESSLALVSRSLSRSPRGAGGATSTGAAKGSTAAGRGNY